MLTMVFWVFITTVSPAGGGEHLYRFNTVDLCNQAWQSMVVSGFQATRCHPITLTLEVK